MKMHSDLITIASAGREDIPELDELYAEACGFFGDDKPSPLYSPDDCLSGKAVPADGLPENFELLTIRVNDMLIGYATIYRDFPGKEYVDLSLMYIGERARGCGFGELSAQLLCGYFRDAGYECIRITVSLRSWGALRFWNRLGFDRVTALSAEGEIDDGGAGFVSLEKRLTVW